MYIPEGYGNIFPYIVVDDAQKLIDFLAVVFGAQELGRTQLPDGRIANMRVNIGSTNFMLAEPEAGVLKPMRCAHYIYVEDVDAAFEKALANGATSIFGATDMPYGDRQAGVTDPCGNFWWISRRLIEEDYAD